MCKQGNFTFLNNLIQQISLANKDNDSANTRVSSLSATLSISAARSVQGFLPSFLQTQDLSGAGAAAHTTHIWIQQSYQAKLTAVVLPTKGFQKNFHPPWYQNKALLSYLLYQMISWFIISEQGNLFRFLFGENRPLLTTIFYFFFLGEFPVTVSNSQVGHAAANCLRLHCS